MKTHHYKVRVEWTGNTGKGTENYRSYGREHTIEAEGKYAKIDGSSDPSFRGDPTRYNPEDLFLSSLSTCHMLWYLHLCCQHGISVIAYTDQATGTMEEADDGNGKFSEVTLFPNVKITDQNQIDQANALHAEANKMCFIANSCNFSIGHKPNTIAG